MGISENGMKRILFVASRPCNPWAGGSYRVHHTLEALVALGFQVDLITVPAPDGCAWPIQGVDRHELPRLPFCGQLPEGPSIRRFILNALLLFRVVCMSGQTRYDMFHGVAEGGVVVWLASMLALRPYVYEYVAPDPARIAWPRRLMRKGFGWMHRCAQRNAEAVIGSDTDVVTILTQWGRGARACVIPDLPAIVHQVSEPEMNLAFARYRSRDGQKIVVSVGSHRHLQGLTCLFNAMPHVLKELEQVRFVIVGGGEHPIEKLRQAVHSAGIEQAVTFTACLPSEELAALLAVADVLVVPDRQGGSVPVKVLDYLYAEKPIVASDTKANRTLLTQHNAMLVRPDPESMAQAILRLCRDPQFAQVLGSRGRLTLQEEGRTPELFRQALKHGYDYVLREA